MGDVRVGTRASALARAQSRLIADALERARPGLRVELVHIETSGDEGAASAPEDKRRWVDRIDDALLAGRIDLAVHSAKDVPAQLADGVRLLAASPREDPRDTLVGVAGGHDGSGGHDGNGAAGDPLARLPPGARVGTSSLRRRAQLLALREDLEIVALRGNVDTRLRRLHEGHCDAIVLAAAGLRRLGVAEGAPIAAETLVPAAGQGILAIAGRDGDEHAAALAALVGDAAALRALTAERALVHGIGADCHTPVGAHAEAEAHAEADGDADADGGDDVGAVDGELRLSAFVGVPDGSAWLRDRLTGADPAALGAAMAERLLAAGARALLDAGARIDV